jgi:uncharacterized membrane protein YvbJ
MLKKLIEYKIIFLAVSAFILILTVSVFALKKQQDEGKQVQSVISTLEKNDKPLILERENFSEESLGYNEEDRENQFEDLFE